MVTNNTLANPPRSLPTLEPLAQLAMPSSTCQLPRRLKRPSRSSLARKSSSVRFLSSSLVSLRLPPRKQRLLLVVARALVVEREVVVGALAEDVAEVVAVEVVAGAAVVA